MATLEYSVAVPAEACSLRMVRAFFEPLLRRRCPDLAAKVILALDEACGNLVKYRSSTIDDGVLAVRAEVGPHRVRFRIGNFCRLAEVPEIVPRDLDDIRPGGLGTHFIREIMDRVDYEEEPGRPGCVALVLEKHLPGDSGGVRADG